jgi:hypothetical protein
MMGDAQRYRVRAELSFQIASVLSDKEAAARIRAFAQHYLELAEQLKQSRDVSPSK